MEEKVQHSGTAQKWVLIYMDEVKLNYDLYDYKRDLRKKLKTLDLDDVKLIFKGRKVPSKVVEVLSI